VHSGHLLGEGDPWLFGRAGVMGFFTWGRLGMDVPRTIYCVSPQTYRVVSVKKSWDGGGETLRVATYRTVLENAIYAARIYPRCANITIRDKNPKCSKKAD